MTLADYAVECGCCREALARPLGHYGLSDGSCMGCAGRSVASAPTVHIARDYARVLKDRLSPADFEAAMAARAAWAEHDRSAA